MPDFQNGLACGENTALAIHAFYPENLPAIFKLAEPTKEVVDYLITTTADKASEVVSRLKEHDINNYKVFIVENRGRDVAPFVNVILPALVQHKYNHFIKIHTKKSPHLNDGADWGSHLISSLVSNRAIKYIRQHFAQDNNTGLLSPPGSIIPITACLNMNALWLAEILAAFGICTKWALQLNFIAGSMFAGRVKPLSPLTNKSPTLECYEPELGQVDATLAHAIERFVSVFVVNQNYQIEQIPGDSSAAPAFGYQSSRPMSSSKTLAQLMQIKQTSY
jgi:lipopolysaccharide biosynthesis protein